MADQRLTDRASTIVIAGGIMHIIIPDGGSPSGYVSRKIEVSALHADLQDAIDQNADDITALEASVTSLFTNVAVYRDIIPTQTTDYEYTHRAGSQVVTITAIGNVASTIKCGTTPGGSEVFDTQDVPQTTPPFSYQSRKEELYNDNIINETLYFTIVGSVKIWVNYEQLT